MNLVVRDETAMVALGGRLARACQGAVVIYLYGPLGAGKTTLVKGFMRGMGYQGAVKSPTYTLVEPYDIAGRVFYHLDLYRVSDASELEYLGLRELQEGDAVVLVEWPEHGQGFLPAADIVLNIEYIPEGRHIELQGCSSPGDLFLKNLESATFSEG